MTRFLLLTIAFFLTINVGAQNMNLSDYSYVIVPQQFDFLNAKDKYKLNSMAEFYFNKSGFNAYSAAAAPNASRCDGLYANVEDLRSVFGTKLQVTLKDCNGVEIFRTEEGKSKYKDFEKSYQDALRKAFNSIDVLNVQQKDVAMLKNNAVTRQTVVTEVNTPIRIEPITAAGNILPTEKFSNYSNAGKTFLLRKTADGYSLYEETTSAEDGLLLKGKIIVMDAVVKFMDTSGKVSDASFDASGNLTVKNTSSETIYLSVN